MRANYLFIEQPEIDNWARRSPITFPSNDVKLSHKLRACNDLSGFGQPRGGLLSGQEGAP